MYIRKFLTRLKSFIFKTNQHKCIHGKGFYSNSLIDTLFPELIEIGDEFVSAPGSIILAHDASTLIHTGKYRIQKTQIGNRVFLGANSVVLPGVTIGNNVIIGAGVVITKDIPSGVVVIGNPGRIVGTVKDYISKCEGKNILFPANTEFINCLKFGGKYKECDLNKLLKFPTP